MAQRSYVIECEDCDFARYDDVGTASAREHHRSTGHQVVCVVEELYLYRRAA